MICIGNNYEIYQKIYSLTVSAMNMHHVIDSL